MSISSNISHLEWKIGLRHIISALASAPIEKTFVLDVWNWNKILQYTIMLLYLFWKQFVLLCASTNSLHLVTLGFSMAWITCKQYTHFYKDQEPVCTPNLVRSCLIWNIKNIQLQYIISFVFTHIMWSNNDFFLIYFSMVCFRFISVQIGQGYRCMTYILTLNMCLDFCHSKIYWHIIMQ